MLQRRPARTAGRAIARAAVTALAALLAPMAAFAGVEGVVKTSVSALSDAVTYSIPGSNPLLTYLGYEVNITNQGGNTVNAVRFTAPANIVSTQSRTAQFSSVEGGSCELPTAASPTIVCHIGQLRAGLEAAPFRIFYAAPSAPACATSSPASPACADSATLAGQTFYAEGNSGGNPAFNSVEDWTAVPVALGTANPTRVKSAVPKAGGNFFTGDRGLASEGDKFASTVRVPGAQNSTRAEILETPFDLTQGCVNFVACYASAITVPTPAGATGFDPYLTITIRIDASNIKPGTKIGSIVPTYTYKIGDEEVVALIGGCGNPLSPSPRSDGLPCIASRTAYGKGNNVPVDLRGDFEWVFINLVNGSFRFP